MKVLSLTLLVLFSFTLSQAVYHLDQARKFIEQAQAQHEIPPEVDVDKVLRDLRKIEYRLKIDGSQPR